MGAGPEDGQALRLQQRLLVGVSFMFILAGGIWGLVYILFAELVAGLIPISYALVSLLSFALFALTGRYRLYRFSQLALILLLPFFLMIALGGFFNSSAVILWAVICPLGALLFANVRQAPLWLAAYWGLLILSGFLEPRLGLANNLPEPLVVGFFVMNLGVVSTIAFILLAYFVQGKNKALDLLAREREKSERLLLNVLPQGIAARLKDENQIIAEHFESLSVLFADVVGFTPLSARLAPQEMVGLLNRVFSHFDTLVEKYGLEKIRTIGDNYMVVSGAPEPRPDHAHALADMALEMNRYIVHNDASGDGRLRFRIGINAGPAIGGVIGQQKFHYDVWGESVNLASRMESQGVPGKIQIAEPFHRLIRDDFICTPRGRIEVKGVGEMQTWFLEGRRARAGLAAQATLGDGGAE